LLCLGGRVVLLHFGDLHPGLQSSKQTAEVLLVVGDLLFTGVAVREECCGADARFVFGEEKSFEDSSASVCTESGLRSLSSEFAGKLGGLGSVYVFVTWGVIGKGGVFTDVVVDTVVNGIVTVLLLLGVLSCSAPGGLDRSLEFVEDLTWFWSGASEIGLVCFVWFRLPWLGDMGSLL